LREIHAESLRKWLKRLDLRVRLEVKNGMYEYKFVKIDLEGFWVGTKKPKEDHHRVIESYAKDGWRLVQIFAPSVSVRAGGVSDYFELIFEKEIK
jgi:hypothetical protein